MVTGDTWGFCDEEPKGKALSESVAGNVKCLIFKKAYDKKLLETADKYSKPENADFLAVPLVNEEIWGPRSPKLRTHDLKAQITQQYLIKGLTAMLSKVEEASEEQKDAVALLTAANYELNLLRRELFKSELNPKLLPLCKPCSVIQCPNTFWRRSH